MIVIISLSCACFSDMEVGLLIRAASCGRNEAVSNRKIKSTENKSTIGVMSTWGVRTAGFILGMGF
jgi:hypothetical protein